MSAIPDLDLPQGVYVLFMTGTLAFVVYNPVTEGYMVKVIKAGTKVGTYSEYRQVSRTTLRVAYSLLIPGWLPNDTIISDVYPELFI